MRKDKDLLGEVLLPDNVYHGAQTERARVLCNPSFEKLNAYPELIHALTQIKKAAAKAHREIGTLDETKADAIDKACDEILAGKFDDHFVVDVFQGGGGVGVHMNVNEVIAVRANEIITGELGSEAVHPNTHVNMGQSTNDVLPAAMKMAVYDRLADVVEAASVLHRALLAKAAEFDSAVKISRTCIQDAVPITLGQTFSGYAALIARRIAELEEARKTMLSLPLGGTVVGTGLGTFSGYLPKVYRYLAEFSGVDYVPEENFFDGLQNADQYITISSCLKSLACGASKIGRDFRMMSSGPRAGLNELELAAVQNGSSIMPGKVNPALPELMNMVCYQICGHDTSITMAAEAGELDLNVWEGIFITNIMASCRLLVECVPVFAEKCVQSVRVNQDVCTRNAENSLALAMVVSAMFGYVKGAEVAEYAVSRDITIKEAVLALGLLSEDQATEVLDPLMLTNIEKSGNLLLSLHKE